MKYVIVFVPNLFIFFSQNYIAYSFVIRISDRYTRLDHCHT